MGGECDPELYPVASDTSSGIGKSRNGRSVCTDCSDRNPSDVCSDRPGTACTVWSDLLASAGKCGKRGTGAAALAVAVKSKDKKIKALALPSSLSAFMGITEPAIFGVNLRFFKPFIAGCIGGGCGALYASIVHLGAKGTGVTGIFGILLCLNQPVQYLIEMAIAVGVAFAVSFILYKDKKEEIKEQAEAVIPAEEIPVSQAEAVTEETLGSPVSGKVVPTAEISDATFAEEILGTTVAVEPEAAELVAPCDGTILSIYDTGHAVCMTTPSGGELLIHAGIDTVKMEGRGFTKCVADGDYVHAGRCTS